MTFTSVTVRPKMSLRTDLNRVIKLIELNHPVYNIEQSCVCVCVKTYYSAPTHLLLVKCNCLDSLEGLK